MQQKRAHRKNTVHDAYIVQFERDDYTALLVIGSGRL